MALTLHNLKPAKGARLKSKRIGRGNASGRGSYSTKGQKGQKARSGGRKGLAKLGLRRLVLSTPKKRGFHSNKPRNFAINISSLDRLCKNGEVIDRARLIELGLLDKSAPKVKILGQGALTKALVIRGVALSETARELITKAGGKIE